MRSTIITLLALGLFAGTANAQPTGLISEDFQSPSYGNGTGNPAFSGWTYNNGGSVKSRNKSQSDFPGPVGNQGLQLEWTNAEANYDVTAPTWNAGDVFTLTLDVAPQSWNGSQDRYIAPSLIQGSPIWSANTLMDKWSGSPVWEQKQYFIPTAGFTSGTDVTLKIDHTGQRGIYFDNVNLTVDAPPADNDPPLPNPPTWDTAPTAFDFTNVFMSVNPATDPFGVEYLFTNTTTSNNSGWQDSTEWVDSGLDQNANYDYTAIARDKSPNQNATGPATDSVTTDGLEGLIFSSGFEYPEHSSNTGNPDFVGWEWTNGGNVKSRTTAATGDLPGAIPNQAVQFEWTNAEGTYDTSHPWSADETYTLTLNASPQSWNGNQDRYLEPRLLDEDGNVLWSELVLLPHYSAYGGNPWADELMFDFLIDAGLFTFPTEGQMLSLEIGHSGFRGIYFDNVMLTFAGPEIAVLAPVPEPATFLVVALGLLGMGWLGWRRRKRA